MTKEEIISRVRDNAGTLDKRQSADIVNRLLEILKQTLKEGEEIKISSFGKFHVQNRKPRIGRNPKTGEEAPITAGKTIKFKPGKPLKKTVF